MLLVPKRFLKKNYFQWFCPTPKILKLILKNVFKYSCRDSKYRSVKMIKILINSVLIISDAFNLLLFYFDTKYKCNCRNFKYRSVKIIKILINSVVIVPKAFNLLSLYFDIEYEWNWISDLPTNNDCIKRE